MPKSSKGTLGNRFYIDFYALHILCVIVEAFFIFPFSVYNTHLYVLGSNKNSWKHNIFQNICRAKEKRDRIRLHDQQVIAAIQFREWGFGNFFMEII